MNNANVPEFDALLAGQNSIKNQMGYDTILSSTRGLEKGICDSTYALNNTVKEDLQEFKMHSVRDSAGLIRRYPI